MGKPFVGRAAFDALKNIPIHSFQVDDASSIPFASVDLTKEGSYDPSVPHRHNYCEVFLFENGGGHHHIDFHTFSIEDHSAHFVSPGQVHQMQRTNTSSGSVLLFSRDFYSLNRPGLRPYPFLNNAIAKPVLPLDKVEFQVLHELVLAMREEQALSDPQSDELTQTYLNTFLIRCKRLFSQDKNVPHATNDSLSFRFKQLIEEHFLQIHSVAEYAEKLRCSEKQLAGSTKKELGVAPKELISDRMLLEAKRLVLYTDHSFQEIAFFLNYTDASHFARFFKGRTGFSPGQFRERGQKRP